MTAATNKKIVVTQVRSPIRYHKKQRETLKALGLNKIGRSIEHTASATVLGMARSVSHLVVVKELP